MTREYYLRSLIADKGSLKDFANSINMPYSTLLSILKNVGGAACDNVFKICRGLNISADSLKEYDSSEESPHCFPLKEGEEEMIRKYRELSPAGKATVDAVIDVQYQAIHPVTKKETC